MGRPKKTETRGRMLGLRLTEGEHERLGSEAERLGVTLTGLAMGRLFGERKEKEVVKSCVECGEAVDEERCPECAMRVRGGDGVEKKSEVAREGVWAGLITGTNIEKKEKLEKILAGVGKLESEGPEEKVFPDGGMNPIFLTRCGTTIHGARLVPGCGCEISDRGRWIRRDGKDKKRGNTGGAPLCEECETMG